MSRSRARLRSLLAVAAVSFPLLVAGGSGNVVSAQSDQSDQSDQSLSHRKVGDAVVVANRGSGDVSVIDVRTLRVTNHDLPGDAEPMYVSHDARRDRVFVGDRASSSVMVLDDESFEVLRRVPVGDGVFHQWLAPRLGQLWVVGDVANTVTVVDARQAAVLATIDIPAALVALGGKPHDVFVKGRHAFVSVLGLDDGSGVVLRYSTRTFELTGRVRTGGDPHLFVRGSRLYVASQDTSTVAVYRTSDLRPWRRVRVPSAHGIWVTRQGEALVSNIAGGGTDAVWDLDRRLRVVDVVDTAVATPHNLVEADGRVYVTHSGATADQVSVIKHGRRGFGGSTTVTVGTNPFGLAHLDR